MRDFSDRRSTPNVADASYSKKRLGGYLVEAGLLTPAQIDVALNDQKLTGMRFGEILAARGWVKQQTIEYLMHKVVLPEQQPAKPANGRVGTAQPRSDVPVTNGSRLATGSQTTGSQTTGSQTTGSQTTGSQTTGSDTTGSQTTAPKASKQLIRRDVPIAKPLPSVSKPDGDISWVG